MPFIIKDSPDGKHKFIKEKYIDSSGKELDLYRVVSDYSKYSKEELEELERLNMELEEAVKKRIKENGRIGRVYH